MTEIKQLFAMGNEKGPLLLYVFALKMQNNKS